jgi:hypothetical protein
MARKVSGYNDLKHDITYQLKPKKLIPFDKFNELVREVRT